MNKPALIVPPAVAAARQQQQIQAVVHPKRCGNCEFGFHDQSIPHGQLRCEGLPPTPLILGANQTPAGLEPNIVLYRPNLPDALKGCALWSSATLANLRPQEKTQQ